MVKGDQNHLTQKAAKQHCLDRVKTCCNVILLPKFLITEFLIDRQCLGNFVFLFEIYSVMNKLEEDISEKITLFIKYIC